MMLTIPFSIKKILCVVRLIFQRTLNKEFCEYHLFGFDTQKALPENAHIEMNQGCNLLDKVGVSYRLTDGTILGLYREGEFIAHDNDIDVDVFDVEIKQVDSIIEAFLKEGFKVGRRAYFKGVMHQVIFYNKREVIFDILFWYRDGGEYINHSERGYVRKQNERYFNNLDEISFKGNAYKTPPHLEEWLEMRYGKDWRTPKTYKGDWKDDCFDLEKIK